MIDYLEPAVIVAGVALLGWGPFLGMMAGFGVKINAILCLFLFDLYCCFI
jgi:hypothetical protein